MADTFRSKREATNPRYFAVDSAIAVAIGDMVWLDTDDVKPAADFTWDTSLAVTQAAFVAKFVGMSIDRSEAGDTALVAIEKNGVKEFTCAAATFEIGDLVGPAKASGNALENQKVVAVATSNLAIGRVAKAYSAVTTTVEVEIFTFLDDMSLGTTVAEIVTALEGAAAGSGAVMDSEIMPAEGFLRKSAAGTYTAVKSNLTATSAPGAGNDNTQGYGICSLWTDLTNDLSYICVDASTGAAVWNRLISAAEGTKLTGIEAAADVTDATNVAAAGAVMDADFAGSTTLGLLSRTGAGTYAVILHNLIATAAPGVNNDGTQGYGIGSRWHDLTNDNVYTCIDATTGAAVWTREISAAEGSKLTGIEASADVTDAANVAAAGAVMDSDFAGSTTLGALTRTGAGAYAVIVHKLDATTAPAVGDDSGDGFGVGSLWVDVTNDKVYMCVDPTVGAAVWVSMHIVTSNIRKEYVVDYTVVADDATANLATIDTGFAAAIGYLDVVIRRAGVDVTVDAVITKLGGGDIGKVTVGDGGATYDVTAGDIISLRAAIIA